MTQANLGETDGSLAPEPGRWTRPPRSSPTPRWFLAAMVASGTLLLAGFVFATPLAWIVGILMAAILHMIKREGGLPTDGSEFRLENPEDLDVCLVDLCVTYGDLRTERDRGAAWFEGPRLCYSGLRTSFAIGGQDVQPSGEVEASVDPFVPGAFFEEAPRERMLLRTIPPVYVSLTPVTQIEGGKSFEREVRFNARLRAFREKRPLAEGSRQLPPTQRPPGRP